jgi:hypothetical protein
MLLHNCIKEYDNVYSECFCLSLVDYNMGMGNGDLGVGFEVDSKLPCERKVNEEVLQVEGKAQQ